MRVSPRRAGGVTLAALRHATAAEHDAVDSLIELDRLVETGYYVAVVRGLMASAEVVEAALPGIPHRMRHQGLSPQDVSKRVAIDSEASFVDHLAGPRPVRRGSDGALSALAPGAGSMAGLLYVYVGSALGGLHMLRVAATAPWWRPDREHVLLRPYGKDLNERWQAVLRALERLDLAETTAAVLAAQTGFDLFHRSLVDQLAVEGVR